MPEKEEIMESTKTNYNKSFIDPDWLALKKEYDHATKKIKKQEKTILEKEKDDFAKMWIAAGLETKESIIENNLRKKGN